MYVFPSTSVSVTPNPFSKQTGNSFTCDEYPFMIFAARA